MIIHNLKLGITGLFKRKPGFNTAAACGTGDEAISAGSVHKEKYCPCRIFLRELGFEETNQNVYYQSSVFRFCQPGNAAKGIDLIFSEDFDVLTIQEFRMDPVTGSITFVNTIAGSFHIHSDEDLKFLFTRNVRLHYMFYSARSKL